MTLRTLNYGNYGIFLIMGNAGFCPSTVVNRIPEVRSASSQTPTFLERVFMVMAFSRSFRYKWNPEP